MHALTVLYAANLAPEAFEPLAGGKSAFDLALERAALFPSGEKILLLAGEGDISLPEKDRDRILAIKRPEWTAADLCAALSEAASGHDFAYYAWADCPFLDPVLAGRIAERHVRYAADYSFSDGWPYGLGPELITSAAAGILSKIAGDLGKSPVKRDSLFAVLQKDINSFDIETEISPVDFRYHRLSLAADSRRNLLLLRRFAGESGCRSVEDAGRIITGHPEYLRTLPAFFPIQVSGPCPSGIGAAASGGSTGSDATGSGVLSGGSCPLCPYPCCGIQQGSVTGGEISRKNFLSLENFTVLLDRIEAFTGDAVIDLSLWGELSLHPERKALIEAVLERPALSLVIETSGYGWAGFDMERCVRITSGRTAARCRRSGLDLSPVSWIVSLGTADLPGAENEAVALVQKLVSVFPKETGQDDRVYVETVRTSGAEDAVEQFYRAWKVYGTDHPGPGIIIQKYDDFCGFLPQKQTVDLSPVERRPCWHLMRDFPILIDGTVPVCREMLPGIKAGGGVPEPLGSALAEDLETLWRRGESRYLSQCGKKYQGPCAVCNEYYTFNF